MTQPDRLPGGGAIDRQRPLRFTFDGRELVGFDGDTLASALLANGVRVVARSFKYHRPRGVYGAGVEEPNALVRIGRGAGVVPNLPATLVELSEGLEACSLNAWPSVERDARRIFDAASALLPAGFYYKTFMFPRTAWMTYERFIRRAAGLGRAPEALDPDRYDKRNAHADVLVIGAGPAGLAAALAAAERGQQVLLCERDAAPGGRSAWDRLARVDSMSTSWTADTIAALRASANVQLLTRTTAVGKYDHNLVTLVERTGGSIGHAGPRERLWKVRARSVVLCTGAFERLLIFAGNDLPGVMLASAAQRYVLQYAVRPGRRVVIATNNDSAYEVASSLRQTGIDVVAIVDSRDEDVCAATAREVGLRVMTNSAVIRAWGRKRVEGASVAPVGSADQSAGASRIECDALLVSGGWDPAVHLFSHAGGRLAFDGVQQCFVPVEGPHATHVAGAAAGRFTTRSCVETGRAAGLRAASEEAAVYPAVGTNERVQVMPFAGSIPAGRAKAFVDLQGDVIADDLRLAAREGFTAAEHAKRYTTTGMGIDQGKIGNIAALSVLAGATERALAGIAPTTYRPPFVPVTFGTLAGREVGALFDPVRETPVGDWHAVAGAVLEPVGRWRRASRYPRAGEAAADTVARECRAVRERAGMLDASTLGKIEVAGPDAAAFLDLVYCTPLATLAVGQCRYGLMLRDTGLVFDDGVVARLGEHHYLLSTTSGNAEEVADWLEEWHQCEWPQLAVRVHVVTAQWATLAVAGPAARAVLSSVESDIDLGADAFPHMAARVGVYGGVSARLLRVSYTGELSFELSVPSRYGRSLWERLLERGAPLGLEPVGLDAIDALRIEKGYIAIGHDTDGTVTPIDLGMDWAVSRKKADFIGKRGMQRPDLVRDGRKQLIGLAIAAPAARIREGSPIVAWADHTRVSAPPVPILGHVTSAARSVTLARTVALGLVAGGRERTGQRMAIVDRGTPVEATIVAPRFYDAEGMRLHA